MRPAVKKDIAVALLLVIVVIALLAAALTITETIRSVLGATYIVLTVDVERDLPPYLSSYRGIEGEGGGAGEIGEGGGEGGSGMPWLLQTLKEAGVPATFFVSGEVAEKYPQFIKQLAAQGEVGVHGLLHENISALNREEKEFVVAAATRAVAEAAESKPASFRAPYHSVDDELLEILKASGYLVEASASANLEYPRFDNETGILRLASAPLFYPSAVYPADWISAFDSALAAQRARQLRVIVIGLHSWELVDISGDIGPAPPEIVPYTAPAGDYTKENLLRLLQGLKWQNVRFVTASEMYQILKVAPGPRPAVD